MGAILFLLVFVAFISYILKLSRKSKNADRGIVDPVTWFIPLHTVEIVIVVWQIITQVNGRAREVDEISGGHQNIKVVSKTMAYNNILKEYTDQVL